MARRSQLKRLMQRFHILPGRHQPPHNDHLRIIARTLQSTGEPLIIGLVTPRPDPAPPRNPFEREAARQHEAGRNPFSLAQRYRMLDAALAEALGPRARGRVAITALPPPDSDWPWVTRMLAGHRTWVIPRCGEAFDDMKAADLRARGETVVRIPLAPSTDGYFVRRLIAAGDPALAAHVPAAVARLIEQWIEQRLIEQRQPSTERSASCVSELSS